jgi:HemY protein
MQAHEINPEADIAIALTQAELQLSRQQNEEALATLTQLLATNPKHDFAMRLMSRAYQQLEDWPRLCPLLADLRRLKILSEDDLQKNEIIAYRGLLTQTGMHKDMTKLESAWQSMPKYLRKTTEMILLYAEQLLANNLYKDAEIFLREKLNKQWNPALITLYSSFLDKISSDNNEHYLNQMMDNVEKWLKNYQHHAVLLLAAGKIAAKLKRWGKAKSFFEASLNSEKLADTYQQIGLLLEQTREAEKAHEYFKKGLAFSLK